MCFGELSIYELNLSFFKPFAFSSQQFSKGAGIFNLHSDSPVIVLTTQYTKLFIFNKCKSAHLAQGAPLLIFAPFCWRFKPGCDTEAI